MICNKCGKDTKVAVSTHKPPITNDCGETFAYTGCYGSYALIDLKRYEWVLCEGCIAKMFKTFKIKPASFDVDI